MKQNKNCWVIPTDKPSRLYLTTHEYIFEEGYSLSTDECENKHIYITNSEEIKEKNYRLNIQRGYFKKSDKEGLDYYNKRNDVFKKIILTTDQDLIKDGVQAIDDEFLEWFVKNPSCEWIEVEKEYNCPVMNKTYDKPYINYKIIIPKTKDRIFSETSEETKQKARDYGNVLAKKETLEKPKTFKELFDNTGIEPTTDENGNIQYNFKATMKEESKQETLEEAAEKYVEDFDLSFYDTVEEIPVKELGKKDFIEGAKCQQHNSFSEEEIMNALHSVELKYNRDFTKIYEGVSKYLKELKNK